LKKINAYKAVGIGADPTWMKGNELWTGSQRLKKALAASDMAVKSLMELTSSWSLLGSIEALFLLAANI
jgi:hypothetical protein